MTITTQQSTLLTPRDAWLQEIFAALQIENQLDYQSSVYSKLLAEVLYWQHQASPESSWATQCTLPNGGQFFFNQHDPGSIRDSFRHNCQYEPTETRFINQHLPTNGVFVDVGANIGYFSALASRIVGHGGKVFAVEPHPENIAFIELNRKLLPYPQNVTVLPFAAGNHTAQIQLYYSGENLGDHRTFDSQDETRQSIPIMQYPLDDILRDEKRVDMIKIDTQGFERHVIEGLEATIKKFHPIILFEFWVYGLRQAGDNPVHLLNLLAAYGYQIYSHGNILRPFRYNANEFLTSDTHHYYDLIAIKTPVTIHGCPLNFATLCEQKPLTTLAIDFGTPFDGSGWHDVETDGYQTWRWSSSTKAIINIWLQSGTDYLLHVFLHDIIKAASLETLKIIVNDNVVPSQIVSTPLGSIIQANISQETINRNKQQTTITIENDTYQLNEVVETTDTRRLGVAVSRINISPANSEED